MTCSVGASVQAAIDAAFDRFDGLRQEAKDAVEEFFPAEFMNGVDEVLFAAVDHLAKCGADRIAFLGCDFAPNPNLVHLHERLGGYLAALCHHRLERRSEWQIVGALIGGEIEFLAEDAEGVRMHTRVEAGAVPFARVHEGHYLAAVINTLAKIIVQIP